MKDTLKTAVIGVDIQNDFCPGGSLAVTNGDQVVQPFNLIVKKALKKGIPVFYSRDWHPKDTTHFANNGGEWPEHCVQGTYGAEFHPDLRQDERITIISKGMGSNEDNYSAFQNTDLHEQLQAQGVKTLIVGGLATDFCVKKTVLDAVERGYQVTLITDAVKAVNINPGDEDRALQMMEGFKARMIESEHLLEEMG